MSHHDTFENPKTQTLVMPVAAAARNGCAVSPAPSARAAAEILQSGGVVATPTDTVYGIAALVQNAAAVKKLYSVKGRDDAKPIAICVAEVKDLAAWGEGTDDLAGVLQDLLPGPNFFPLINIQLIYSVTRCTYS